MHQPVHWLRRVGSDLKTPGNLAECHEFQRYVPRLFACLQARLWWQKSECGARQSKFFSMF